MNTYPYVIEFIPPPVDLKDCWADRWAIVDKRTGHILQRVRTAKHARDIVRAWVKADTRSERNTF